MKPYGVKKKSDSWEECTSKPMPVGSTEITRPKKIKKNVKRTLKKAARRNNKIF